VPEQPKRRKPTRRRPKNQTADQVVADQVRRLRERRGITQQELADKLGWPQSTIARLELGNRSISVSDLLALCWALDVAPVYMLDGSFQTGDIPIRAGLRVPTERVRWWIRGGEPLPGSDYRAYIENIPDDEWLELHGPPEQQRRDLLAAYESADRRRKGSDG
jgi:transcriptional regulator with XRE-family HTH domain